MAFQPVAATAQVEFVYSWNGQTCENNLFFRQDASFSASELVTLSAAAMTWWILNIGPLLSEDISLVAVKATALHAQTGPQYINTATLPAAGDVPSNSVPNNVAYCVSFRTSLIGRAFRGRNYVPGLPASVFDQSQISPTTSAAIVAAYDDLISNPIAGTSWVVVTRQVNGVVQSPVALTNPVTSVQAVDLVADSQRRRLPGRGT